MRVIQVLPELSIRAGGPPLATVGLASALARLGVECVIAATTTGQARLDSGEFPAEIESLQTKLFQVRAWDKLAVSSSLLRELESLGRVPSTLIHVQGLFQYPQWAAYKVSTENRLPLIVTPRGALDPTLRSRGKLRKKAVERLWQRSMMDSAAAIHYTSGLERDLAADLGYRSPTVVIPNGLSPMLPDRTSMALQLLPEGAYPVIGYHGRLDPKKGLPILLGAFAGILTAYPNARLLLIGPDSRGHERDLRTLCLERQIEDRVIFAGTRTRGEIAALLEHVDVWAMPTLSENFGNGLVEAMSVGLPCITTAGVNIAPDAERAGGLVIAERTETGFATAILNILTDKSVARSLAENGRTFASQFDWDTVAKQFIQVYEEALASCGIQNG